jgi:CubicO group peptidase (beta-lactamase class C family)
VGAHWLPDYPPNTVGRYRNTDPVLVSYLIRFAVEKSGEEYLSYPQRALFDKIGVRAMRIETDPFGNFLGQGYEVGSGRDWARLGNLYLQDGVWNGERILPSGYAKFVSTLAPAWAADKRPVYGAFFWINGDGALPIPREAYLMNGAGAASARSSSRRMTSSWCASGTSDAGMIGLKNALALLMQGVPKRN